MPRLKFHSGDEAVRSWDDPIPFPTSAHGGVEHDHHDRHDHHDHNARPLRLAELVGSGKGVHAAQIALERAQMRLHEMSRALFELTDDELDGGDDDHPRAA